MFSLCVSLQLQQVLQILIKFSLPGILIEKVQSQNAVANAAVLFSSDSNGILLQGEQERFFPCILRQQMVPLGLNQHLNLLQAAVRLPLQNQHVIRLKPLSLFEGIQMEHPLISNENHLLVDLPKPVDVCIKVRNKGLLLRRSVIIRIGKPILTGQIQPVMLIHRNIALRHAHTAAMRPGIVDYFIPEHILELAGVKDSRSPIGLLNSGNGVGNPPQGRKYRPVQRRHGRPCLPAYNLQADPAQILRAGNELPGGGHIGKIAFEGLEPVNGVLHQGFMHQRILDGRNLPDGPLRGFGLTPGVRHPRRIPHDLIHAGRPRRSLVAVHRIPERVGQLPDRSAVLHLPVIDKQHALRIQRIGTERRLQGVFPLDHLIRIQSNLPQRGLELRYVAVVILAVVIRNRQSWRRVVGMGAV